MKILQVVPSYLPGRRYGGPIRSVHGLSKALVARGHEVHVWTTDRDEDHQLDVSCGERREFDGVQVRYFAVRGPGRLRYAPGLRRALNEQVGDFDLVHAHGVFQAPTSLALRAAQAAGIPTVLSPRGMLQREVLEARGRLRKRLWLRGIDLRALRGLTGVHLTSELERNALEGLSPSNDQLLLQPNGVEREPFDGDWNAVDDAVADLCAEHSEVVLFLGRINWKKGLDLLAEAFAGLPGDAHLVVAGPDDGGRASFEARVHELGLASRVTLTGVLRGTTLSALLEHARCLVLPSRSENFGNVVLEAMAVGTPPIVTPEVGAAEWVRRGAGLVVPAEPDRWCAALGGLLADSGRREKFAARGRELAREGAAWPSIAAEFESAYLRWTAGPSSGVQAA